MTSDGLLWSGSSLCLLPEVRTPLGCFYRHTGEMQLLIWESPQDIARDEALRVLAEYHGEGDRDSPIVQLEYGEMIQEIIQNGADKRSWDYRELFNTRETGSIVMLICFGCPFVS